jgi:thioredoxin reductase
VAVDAASATTVPGVFAAGDVTGRMPSVANAVAAGSSAAAMVVNDLMSEAHGRIPAGAGSAAR